MLKNNIAFIALVFMFLQVSLLYGTPLALASGKESKEHVSPLQQALIDFSEDPALENTSWGFHALNTETGDVVASHQPDLALIPASALKVVTTLTSLAILGSEYHFETLLQYDGNIHEGVLDGNLYIKGSGDPSLGAVMMDESLALENVYTFWLEALNKSGIEKIEGAIIADGSYFDDHMIPAKWFWEDIGNYYGAGAHALTAHENLYSVFFEPGSRVGEPAEVNKTEPVIMDMTFRNDVTTGPRGSGDRVYIYGVPHQQERWLTGTVPLGESNFEVKGSMPDPGLFLAQGFSRFLMENQLPVADKAHTHITHTSSARGLQRVTLARWVSPSLKDIAQRTNFRSVNTYAENLIKVLGKQVNEEGSFEAGANAITDFWDATGINTKGMRIHDGSGLSPFNNITVRQLGGILEFAAHDQALFEALTAGFPVAAQSGSLSRMFHNTPSSGVLIAKSGFLSNVRSYAGYTYCQNDNLIAFTIIVNNYDGSALQMRARMEKVMDAITRSGF